MGMGMGMRIATEMRKGGNTCGFPVLWSLVGWMGGGEAGGWVAIGDDDRLGPRRSQDP